MASDNARKEPELPAVMRPRIFQWTTSQEPPNGYPIRLQLHYRATSKMGPLYGFGQTTMMSSQEIIFTSDDGLSRGCRQRSRLLGLFLDYQIRFATSTPGDDRR
jgi:hypothetical protein